MVSNPIPDELKSTHLFLLVGTNPLPDWVASRLLAHDSAQLYLVYSARTFRIAEQLAKYLMNNCNYRQPAYVKVDNPYKAGDVYGAVAKKLKDITSGTVGLNYTGGTKVMATHSFRALEQECPKGLPPIVFSYLEAPTCTMRFDPTPGSPHPDEYRVGFVKEATLSLTEMFSLHDDYLVNPPEQTPVAEPVFNLLVQEHSIQNRQQFWRKQSYQLWRYQEKTKPRGKRTGHIMDEQDARQVLLRLDPSFSAIAKALYPSASAGGATLGDIVQHGRWRFKNAKELADWLDGKWLEHYVLKLIADNRSSYQVGDFGRNINPYPQRAVAGRPPDKFEGDVAALRGCQLHLISCYSGDEKERCKLKLFEVFIRARQLGGDTSRAALVCCSDDPAWVEMEINHLSDIKDHVKVFGRQHLSTLGQELHKWFDTGVQEG